VRGAAALLAAVRICGCTAQDAVSGSGPSPTASLSPSPPPPSATLAIVPSREPLLVQGSPSPLPDFTSGACTLPGLSDRQLLDEWIALAGRHDVAAVRDCFAASYPVPDQVVDRWANEGVVSAYVVTGPDVMRNCRWFGVTADFPDGNPYAPVQDATRMFLFIGLGDDGGRPRIFGTATGVAHETAGPTPYTGPPDCR
jgi:hypothetical protein